VNNLLCRGFHARICRFVFQGLPEPNGVAVRCLHCHTMPPTFLIWNNLSDLVYQTPTETYRSQESGSFRYTRSRDYQTPTRHALLGHRKRALYLTHNVKTRPSTKPEVHNVLHCHQRKMKPQV